MHKSLIAIALLSAFALAAPAQAQNTSNQGTNSSDQATPGNAGDQGTTSGTQRKKFVYENRLIYHWNQGFRNMTRQWQQPRSSSCSQDDSSHRFSTTQSPLAAGRRPHLSRNATHFYYHGQAEG